MYLKYFSLLSTPKRFHIIRCHCQPHIRWLTAIYVLNHKEKRAWLHCCSIALQSSFSDTSSYGTLLQILFEVDEVLLFFSSSCIIMLGNYQLSIIVFHIFVTPLQQRISKNEFQVPLHPLLVYLRMFFLISKWWLRTFVVNHDAKREEFSAVTKQRKISKSTASIKQKYIWLYFHLEFILYHLFLLQISIDFSFLGWT